VALDDGFLNDPRDIARLIEACDAAHDESLQLIRDSVSGDVTLAPPCGRGSANGVRAWLLKESTPHTGRGIKLFPRDTFLSMPRFDHMHRFPPALFQRAGARVISLAVSQRPCLVGTSKRITDLIGVMWPIQRRCHASVRELCTPWRCPHAPLRCLPWEPLSMGRRG
jgi:dolichol-phosphate mannosyltransferase